MSGTAHEPPTNPPLPFTISLSLKHPALRHLPFGKGVLRHFGAGYATRGIMTGRLAVPIRNLAGVLVAYAGVRPQDLSDWLFPRGFEPGREIFNAHRVLERPERIDGEGLVVVEGILDAFRVVEAGFESVVALLDSEPSHRLLATLSGLASFGRKAVLLLPEGELRERVLVHLAQTIYVRALYPVEKRLWELSAPECSRLILG